eukprot:TRINITY_DN14424_c0_g1_i1.p1 TRINITY_DN14424_c0_g1~~TRINITY_DN14424_c0_g1_i1.p1  ORF type:complete len:385 (-),score=86.27 TRINITY_DN14424_c0_g1_i1:1184-2338(-)
MDRATIDDLCSSGYLTNAQQLLDILASATDLDRRAAGLEEADTDSFCLDLQCPYCYEGGYELAGFCAHLECEHYMEAKPVVCPVCDARVSKDLFSHITAKHAQLLKSQRRRRSRRPSDSSSSLLPRVHTVNTSNSTGSGTSAGSSSIDVPNLGSSSNISGGSSGTSARSGSGDEDLLPLKTLSGPPVARSLLSNSVGSISNGSNGSSTSTGGGSLLSGSSVGSSSVASDISVSTGDVLDPSTTAKTRFAPQQEFSLVPQPPQDSSPGPFTPLQGSSIVQRSPPEQQEQQEEQKEQCTKQVRQEKSEDQRSGALSGAKPLQSVPKTAEVKLKSSARPPATLGSDVARRDSLRPSWEEWRVRQSQPKLRALFVQQLLLSTMPGDLR